MMDVSLVNDGPVGSLPVASLGPIGVDFKCLDEAVRSLDAIARHKY